jgi:single-strand DNA-binding protein
MAANGLNNCAFIGNLGKDPDVKTVGGQTVANFTLAVNESWTDKQGQKQERVEWVRFAAWGKKADVIAKYCTKGQKLYVAGRLQTREYEKNGEKRYATDIVVNDFLFLGGGKGAAASASSGQSAYADDDAAVADDFSTDDIPF